MRQGLKGNMTANEETKVKADDAKAKAEIIARKCKKCGQFGRRIEKDNPEGLPEGWYCDACKRHSEQKCAVEQMLTPALIEMVKEAPMNPTIRAHIHCAVKVPVPEDLDTWEKIKRWIEFKFVAPNWSPLEWRSFRDNAVMAPAIDFAEDIVVANNGVSAMVRCTDWEKGTCNYSGGRSGTGRYHLDPDDIFDIAQNSESMTDFLSECADRIREIAAEDPPDMDCSEGYDYDDHNTTELEDFSATIRENERFFTDLQNWLRNRYPEAYHALNGH